MTYVLCPDNPLPLANSRHFRHLRWSKMTEQKEYGDFILGSASPRRRELLRQVGLSFKVVPSKLQEVNQGGTEPHGHATYYAEEKAREVAQRHRQEWCWRLIPLLSSMK